MTGNEFVVLSAATPHYRFNEAVNAWNAGYRNPGVRVFDNAANAEKYARRSGRGAKIYHGTCLPGAKLVAEISVGSFPKCKPVTEVTWYGGRFI